MRLKSLEDANIRGKTVLYRAPYDIDTEERDGMFYLSDDTRIRATLPTLEHLLQENCKIVILTYVGRPDGKVVESLRTAPHAKALSEMLGRSVLQGDDCVGPSVEAQLSQMKEGDILMLENVRFHKEEMADDDEFARELCAGKDIVVFDGFPQAHRIHASTTGIERHLPAVAGLYLEREVGMLSALLEGAKRPFSVIIGGAKISDKIDAVNNLLKLSDKVLIGGAVANVFLKAEGRKLGNSFVEDVFVDEKRREKKNWVEYAAEILQKYKDKVVYPNDVVATDGISAKTVDISSEEVPDGWMAVDIGPKTQKIFSDIVGSSGTVFLAGPMGKFEDERSASGSRAVFAAMEKLTKKGGETIVAGGDTIDAVRRLSDINGYSFVSLAGGATLEFLAGKTLPALVPLMKD